MAELKDSEGNTLFCIECEDVPAALICEGCGNEPYCGLCFKYIHKTGSRKAHNYHLLPGVDMKEHTAPNHSAQAEDDLITEVPHRTLAEILNDNDDEDGNNNEKKNDDIEINDKIAEDNLNDNENQYNSSSSSSSEDDEEKEDDREEEEEEEEEKYDYKKSDVMDNILEFSKWVPVRLNEDERKLLQILEGALEVSDYTNKVDVSFDYYGWNTGGYKKRTIIDQEINEIVDLITGLCISSDHRSNVRIITRALSENIPFFQRVFEVGRRFKIMNPDKMRSTYGKLMHMLQDCVSSPVLDNARPLPIKTVHSVLEARGALAMLSDPGLYDAVKTIGSAKAHAVNSAAKQAAQDAIVKKYAGVIGEDEAYLCIQSLSDADAYLVANRDPVDKMLYYLEEMFPSEEPYPSKTRQTNYYNYRRNYYDSSSSDDSDSSDDDDSSDNDNNSDNNEGNGGEKNDNNDTDQKENDENKKDKKGEEDGIPWEYKNLEIMYGRGGSCMSQCHSDHHEFVRQSLLLWREVQNQMFRLWYLEDLDFLTSGGEYRLWNTGQGLNRMQSAPNISRAMSQILAKVRGSINRGWVGLSVVHLGDRDVPNAFFFIDKYSQVPRILGPLATAIERIDILAQDPRAKAFVEEFGGPTKAKYLILRDYFRHGFDGSGSDGGSCIDGRLTSTWNWCSLVEKKSYYPLLLATGFSGFDGSF